VSSNRDNFSLRALKIVTTAREKSEVELWNN